MKAQIKDNGSKSTERIVNRFTEYLNGPMGKSTFENIDEGKSFVLETYGHILSITKKSGKAVVELLERNGET